MTRTISFLYVFFYVLLELCGKQMLIMISDHTIAYTQHTNKFVQLLTDL